MTRAISSAPPASRARPINYNAICWRKVGPSSYVAPDLGRTNWPYAFGQAINNAGDIVFSATDGGIGGSGNRRTFLWRQNARLPLGELVPAWTNAVDDAYGWAINSLGSIVGTANASSSPGVNPLKIGWRYNGCYRDNLHSLCSLTNLPGVTGIADSSGAYGVNDYGDFAGHYMRTDFGSMGCFVASGTNAAKVSGWHTYFEGMNNQGDPLVSSNRLWLYGSTNASAPARLSDGRPDYSDHSFFALADLLPGDTGPFTSLDSSAEKYSHINEARAIVGEGVTPRGATHAFLATPLFRHGNRTPVAANVAVTNHSGSLSFPISMLFSQATDADGDPLALNGA
jgi:hypothetical protein